MENIFNLPNFILVSIVTVQLHLDPIIQFPETLAILSVNNGEYLASPKMTKHHRTTHQQYT
jgi:hypothetical protein